ncbi:hypothetical protein Tco_0157756 [Tanacetum coccineum]
MRCCIFELSTIGITFYTKLVAHASLPTARQNRGFGSAYLTQDKSEFRLGTISQLAAKLTQANCDTYRGQNRLAIQRHEFLRSGVCYGVYSEMQQGIEETRGVGYLTESVFAALDRNRLIETTSLWSKSVALASLVVMLCLCSCKHLVKEDLLYLRDEWVLLCDDSCGVCESTGERSSRYSMAWIGDRLEMGNLSGFTVDNALWNSGYDRIYI